MKESMGFFGLGVHNPKFAENVGSLWRTADLLGCDFFFTIGNRYAPQSSDTRKSWKRIPLFEFPTLDAAFEAMPRETLLVGVELSPDATPLERFRHPERACYLLGAEDNGLPPKIIARCHHVVVLPGEQSMNLACAGSILVYDRVTRGGNA